MGRFDYDTTEAVLAAKVEEYATKAEEPTIVRLARLYADLCQRLDRLRQEHRKLSEELKQTEGQCKETKDQIIATLQSPGVDR